MGSYRDTYFVPRDSGLLEAKAWLAKNENRVHPAFSSHFRYDDQRAQLTPQKQKAIDIFQSHSDRFLRALEICQKISKHDLKDLDISKSRGWDDVMAEYGHACRKYETKAKGLKGLSRKVGRMTGDNAPSVIPFLNFIPEGQYKTLFAGLVLIFGAAGRMSNRRQLILETFEGIPTIIYHAEKCYECYPADESLQHEVMELYIAILVAIMDMMEWLVETGGWKQIKALCQGPRYGGSLDEKINDVKKHSASVQCCIDRLSREAIARTESKTEQTVHLATDIKANTRKIEEDSAVSRTGIARIEITQTTITDMIHKMQKNVETVLQEDFRNKEWSEKQELVLTRLEDKVQSLTVNLEEAQAHNKRGMILESHQLLELLAINRTEIAKNLTSMLRLGQAADSSYHNRGSLLMRSPDFQHWLTSTSPIFLLVDGNGHSAAERTSAMTFISALLAQSLSDEGASCIHYFCGLHTARSDDLSGPSGLLRALLAQLVSLHALRVGFTDNSEYHELQRFDNTRLCTLFSDLVKDLPKGLILVCIIDGVSLYETSEWTEDLRRILETLNDLTRDPEVCAVFKVLVTSALASRQATRYIPFEDHLRLPLNAGDGTDSPLTARHLKMRTRRSTESRARSQSPDSIRSIFPEAEAVDNDEGFVDGIFDD